MYDLVLYIIRSFLSIHRILIRSPYETTEKVDNVSSRLSLSGWLFFELIFRLTDVRLFYWIYCLLLGGVVQSERVVKWCVLTRNNTKKSHLIVLSNIAINTLTLMLRRTIWFLLRKSHTRRLSPPTRVSS